MIEFYLKNDSKSIKLPVSPNTFEVTAANLNSSINIENIGEINLIGKPALKTFSFEGFFVKRKQSYSSDPAMAPYEYVDTIISMKLNAIRFIVTETNINLECTIENFTYLRKDGTGDVYYSLELKEYKRLKTQTVSNVNNSSKTSNTNRDSSKVNNQKTYTVKKGDTLWGIAQRFLGSGSRYTEIYNKNRDKIKAANLIYPGQVLNL